MAGTTLMSRYGDTVNVLFSMREILAGVLSVAYMRLHEAHWLVLQYRRPNANCTKEGIL